MKEKVVIQVEDWHKSKLPTLTSVWATIACVDRDKRRNFCVLIIIGNWDSKSLKSNYFEKIMKDYYSCSNHNRVR